MSIWIRERDLTNAEPHGGNARIIVNSQDAKTAQINGDVLVEYVPVGWRIGLRGVKPIDQSWHEDAANKFAERSHETSGAVSDAYSALSEAHNQMAFALKDSK